MTVLLDEPISTAYGQMYVLSSGDEDRRIAFLEKREGELLEPHRIAGGAKLVGHILGGLIITRGTGRAVASVGGCDVLQRLHVAKRIDLIASCGQADIGARDDGSS